MSRPARLTAAAVLAWALAGILPSAGAAIVEPAAASVAVAPSTKPPGPEASWQTVALPDDAGQSRPAHATEAAWYRIEFDRPQGVNGDMPWAVYLPYLYSGGSVWLNGALLSRLPVSDARINARSFRPSLIVLPPKLLNDGGNQLSIGVAPSGVLPLKMAQVSIGPLDELTPLFKRRQFWATIVPQLAVFGSAMVAGFMLMVWWRRRDEVLYGLFGLAAALWGIRSMVFVIESMPWDQWNWWRVVYQSATGGFVIAMALFTLRLARLEMPWLERALIGYGLVGPLWFAVGGFAADDAIGRWWLGGMMVVGGVIIAVTLWSMREHKNYLTGALRLTTVISVLAGIHDYLLAWHPWILASVLPEWTAHRIFLLHLGTSAMVLAMGGIMTGRSIKSMVALEDLNRNLEARVADRERELAANYKRMAELEREHAAAEERQLIMRDLHDGLGSQLFTSLMRVERGDMSEAQIAESLRECIADMRLALDAMASQENDVGAALGNFMTRWESQLVAAGVRPNWDIDSGGGILHLAPHSALQLLRVAQEALTNVLKHAGATQVQVRLHNVDGAVELQVEDNGKGLSGEAAAHSRGIVNMRTRARRLGGKLDLRSNGRGSCVVLQVPADAVVQ
ncbi:MAG: ATP-binding protein [Burkholderiales bacterium]